MIYMTVEQLQGLAGRLKEYRKSKHWTQEKTAEMLDITYSSYSKIENGFQQPGIDLLIKMSDTFSLSLDYLLFGIDERKLIKLSENQKVSLQEAVTFLTQVLEE